VSDTPALPTVLSSPALLFPQSPLEWDTLRGSHA